ncbi:MAG: hypothetical protein LBE21_01620 [Pseudomonadales bacterium]|jgi:uncharacterized membrane protein|nr:hypothetical protein [Pseudomonadales bacterium]
MLLSVLLLHGCASGGSVFGGDPIVDLAGVNAQVYNRDLADCRTYADQVQTGRRTVASAATGAVVGSLLGAAVGNSDSAQAIGGAGGVMGGVSGASAAMSERQQVLRNCLIGRGYRVLN